VVGQVSPHSEGKKKGDTVEMDDQERQQSNKQAIQDLRKATALYIVQLRNLGFSEEEVGLMVQEANLEIARKMGTLLPGEENPRAFSEPLLAFVKDVMEHGA
jgi:hypothetical protein